MLFSYITKVMNVPNSHHFPTFLVKLTGECIPHRGCPLIAWPWWPEGLNFWALWNYNYQRNSSGQATTYKEQLRYHTTSLKYTSILPVKKTHLFVLEL